MSKITPAVLTAIEGHDPHSYVRVWCRLCGPTLTTAEREVLENELSCTHFMFTGFVCSIEVPIKHLERVASFDSVARMEKAVVF